MSVLKVWVLGASHPNADKSISWNQQFPNFTEPDVLIINLTTLDKKTLTRINPQMLDQARSFILDKFRHNGIVIFITAPFISITKNHQYYSNYDLSPIRLNTRNVPQVTRKLYHNDYDFKKYADSVKSFDFYLETFDSGMIDYFFQQNQKNVKAFPLDKQYLKDNGGNFLGLSFSLFEQVSEASIYHEESKHLKGSGEIIFLPPPTETIEEALALLLYRYGKTISKEETIPNWVSKITLPSISKRSQEIKKLELQSESLQEQINKLVKENSEILNFRKLIYSKNSELEDIVFETFKLLGFEEIQRIRESDREDWVFEFKYEKQFKYGIIEVKGADTRTKQQHIVQTSKWVDERFAIDEKISKGVFIPNQHRLNEYPKSKKEREKFEPNELEYSQMKSICIIPTFVLFEAVKEKLDGKNKTRKDIEKIIATTNGVITRLI